MVWLLRDLDLAAVLLRAASLAFEALLVGGVLYLLVAALPSGTGSAGLRRSFRGIRWAGIALIVTEVLTTANSIAMLMGDSPVTLRQILSADFFTANATAAAATLLILFLLRNARRSRVAAATGLALVVVVAAVWTSHSMSRMEHRALLATLTAAHHLGTAAWIGAMPFMIAGLKYAEDGDEARRIVRRFSAMALVAVGVLVAAGIALAWFFVGTWSGLYGTAYGVLLLAKIYLLLMMLTLGAGNYFLVRRVETAPAPLLVRLRRFSEAEIGLGFTAILVAASLTSQPAAVDVTDGRLTAHEIAARMHPQRPRLSSPAFQQLAPPTPMAEAVQDVQFSGGSTSDANDRAWSEYNHHWAGLIVLAAGTLALLARSDRARWARHWPLAFIGLAVFIVLRADPECWPLGPRPFWQSFAEPDALEHRLYALLIVAFAVFEWGVETGRWASRRAAAVFPLLCAIGGALMMTHSHGLADQKEELLAEMSHTPIALLGATAGWSRWLELRLPERRESRIAAWIWPACLMLVGLILLNYRES
jgi:putative copper resistance protein D